MPPSPCSLPRLSCSAVGRSGSTLLICLLTVTVLSMIAGWVLSGVTSRYNSAYRSAGWNDALVAAESGVDTTLSQLTALLPEVCASSTGLGAGYSQDAIPNLLSGVSLSPDGFLSGSSSGGSVNATTGNTILSFTPPALVHGGEGGTTEQAIVTMQNMSLAQLLAGGFTGTAGGPVGSMAGPITGNSPQMLCLYSTGTADLAGGTVTDPNRQNNDLWRPSLVTNRSTGKAVGVPSVSRTIAVILRPVYPFESAVVSDNAFQSTAPGALFDSFNSALASASTNSQYDSSKHLSAGTVYTNGPSFLLAGKVYGNVGTNGGTLPQDGHETGTVNNSSYVALPRVKAPVQPLNLLAYTLSGSESRLPGPASVPTRYSYNGITGNLHIVNPLAAKGLAVIIFVNGDLTGGVEIDNGITAKVYVTGSIITSASQLKNDSSVASNLQIYGVPASASSAPVIRLNSDASLAVSIYAPAHACTIDGGGDVSGAIVASSFQATGPVRVHYDEALALGVGPILRYQIASWQEITN